MLGMSSKEKKIIEKAQIGKTKMPYLYFLCHKICAKTTQIWLESSECV